MAFTLGVLVATVRAHRLALPVLAVSCGLGLAPGPASAQTARAPKPVVGCMIAPDRVADVGSPVVGIVSRIKVDVGDTVQVGQSLVLLRSEVEDASMLAAKARSGIDAEVLAAEANLELNRQRHARAQDLQSQGFASSQATDQARVEEEIALQRLRQARGQRTVSARELGVVNAQLGQRNVRSHFSGVVVERYVNAGERVEEKPMLRLAVLDPLRVELVVPASRYGSVAPNDAISILPELPGAGAVTARVTHVDPIIDAASNTFRVRLNLPNPGHKLPGGARCRAELAAPADARPVRAEPVTLPRKVAG